MEHTADIRTLSSARLTGPSPLLRVASDEKLVAMTRAGNEGAYEALVSRYQSRLLSFCRHMLSSKEDAEDVLQEVFAAAYNALLADDRPVNVRPWLYRIARNRSLNHLRKRSAIGVDSMDIHYADHGTTTADRVHQREEFRQLMTDVRTLPETQRTALLLREIDALSYDQIAEAMDTTVPSVKSLLVRARVSLAEAAESRALTCEEVREELGFIAEGIASMSPPIRRHVRDCARCGAFKKHLKANNRQLAAIFPLGPLLLFKKFVLAQGAGAGAAGTATASSSALSAGLGTVASKAAAGMAAAAIVTAGAAEYDHANQTRAQRPTHPILANVHRPTPAPVVIDHEVQPPAAVIKQKTAPTETDADKTPDKPTATPVAPAVVPAPQQQTDTTSLPPQTTATTATPPPITTPVTIPTTTVPVDPTSADQPVTPSPPLQTAPAPSTTPATVPAPAVPPTTTVPGSTVAP